MAFLFVCGGFFGRGGIFVVSLFFPFSLSVFHYLLHNNLSLWQDFISVFVS